MTVTMSAYINLRNEIVSNCTPCSDQFLRNLKDNFEDIINSRRRLENISSVEELVRILEKRSALNVHKLDCLKDIARSINRPDLLQLLNDGLGHSINVPPHIQQLKHIRQAPVLSLPPADYKEQIYELLIDQIGNKWKVLARYLDIKEGKIDNLAERYCNDPSERIREILKYHEARSPTHEVWSRLMDALEKCRRKDLRDEVQRILNSI